jgi:acetyltransferase-like isoleucine patch superfamily enzyme
LIDATGGSIKLDSGSSVARFTVLQAAGGWIRVGEGSLIGDFSNLYGQGGLSIGAHVMLASGVRVLSAEHVIDHDAIAVSDGLEHVAFTVIEDGAWIGANCVVMAGVRIGSGAVVGAGSIVTASVPARSVSIGVPSRVVRQRRSSN